MKTILRGVVVSGISRAGYYVERYKELFRPLLGGDPYPGTLNIKLERCIWDYLRNKKPIIVKPLEPGLCEAYVFKGKLGEHDVLVVKPSATIHDCNVVELIAVVKLRDALNLRDGDIVEVTLTD